MIWRHNTLKRDNESIALANGALTQQSIYVYTHTHERVDQRKYENENKNKREKNTVCVVSSHWQ